MEEIVQNQESKKVTKVPGSYYATGRRKRSIARVWLFDGTKDISVNGRTMEDFFPRETHRMIIRQPFEATKLTDRFGIRASVEGGGGSGQAGAVRLGVARALIVFDEKLKTVLRKAGLVTGDPRERERKKYGKKGARRSFQYTKR